MRRHGHVNLETAVDHSESMKTLMNTEICARGGSNGRMRLRVGQGDFNSCSESRRSQSLFPRESEMDSVITLWPLGPINSSSQKLFCVTTVLSTMRLLFLRSPVGDW